MTKRQNIHNAPLKLILNNHILQTLIKSFFYLQIKHSVLRRDNIVPPLLPASSRHCVFSDCSIDVYLSFYKFKPHLKFILKRYIKKRLNLISI